MIVTREATNQDIEGINAVIETNWVHGSSTYNYPCKYDESDIYTKNEKRTFIAEEGKIIVAFLQLNFERCSSNKEAEIIIVVRHDRRKKGYAKELVDKTILYVKEKTKVVRLIANVKGNNINAIAFFRKLGFKEDSNKCKFTYEL